ncbi:16S rRNA (uracil(1498)-N(3))-methyltransferase [Sinomicrobium weinanense]|uniref:Ribosomal RNA small subunit methyltransferase E n=1 Tax=Sinomicrobium weinanense TaxID=2842200 RepID=A0A926JQ96_9FLAO|nr:16S rRNA (uracil(1498)-N(3))-methyltransferase [Sinomicrobium weinanense]MBC9795500.1 16S rRNA (uracil(1498)-N(3))-methyltransferase [Sinomicrobium weinanense]MBU3123353.1 16S rRNA (uracil(1498)-N(3))-methyltransferase [Sinomicrobium weinanense]
MNLFYSPDISEEESRFVFDREESRHIAKVLRKKEGDHIHLTNGKGWIFEAEIILADIKHCTARITGKTQQPPRTYGLHLAVAPTKMNDRYEWFLEKATEIGIDEITPVICDHSERTKIKPERLERIIQSAMKQSLSAYLPKVNPAMPLHKFLQRQTEGQVFIAHCEEEERFLLKQKITPGQNITVLIGPEGDFSGKEIALAKDKGYIPVSLGNTRLRTETAAIVACHTVALMNQKI